MGGISSAGKKTVEMSSTKRLKKTLMQVAQKRSNTRRVTGARVTAHGARKEQKRKMLDS
jgi:hypothetical protein